jgi:tetratricopeptide (TPR) repeat protein
MEGRFEDARDALRGGRAILEDLGLRVAAAQISETEGIVELLASDPEAAEYALRYGYERLEEIGERFNFADLAALLAGALSAQGRHDEALRLATTAAQAAAPDDRSGQIHWRVARARALAGLGRLDEANPLAREAVRLAETTDFLDVHGDALTTLADVLRAHSRGREADELLRAALELYERKGNVVCVARSRAALESREGNASGMNN